MTTQNPAIWYPYDPTVPGVHSELFPAATAASPVRSWRKPAVLAGIAAAVVTGIVVGTSQSSRHHASLCSDYAALGQYQQLNPETVTPGQLNDMDRLLHRLASEAPASGRRAINEVAEDVDQQISTGISYDTNEAAAANRADAVLQAACPGVGR